MLNNQNFTTIKHYISFSHQCVCFFIIMYGLHMLDTVLWTNQDVFAAFSCFVLLCGIRKLKMYEMLVCTIPKPCVFGRKSRTRCTCRAKHIGVNIHMRMVNSHSFYLYNHTLFSCYIFFIISSHSILSKVS